MEYIGRIIKGRYKIYDKVGSGGMATVYLARDLQTNEVVALKILREEFSEEKNYIKRFVREAETALKLKHPNITRVKDFGREGNTYYIVMEYVQGKTLEEIAEEKGRLPIGEVAKIGMEVAKALDYSVKHGIIAHRDIKPQNIMLTRDGSVKVMDFGVAKISSMNTITSEGSIIGTPFYISPEQAKGKPVDVRSDLYSLGITLYRLLSGKVPFDAENPWSVINMHITMPPPKIESIVPSVPKRLADIIYKLLEKDPAKRYQTPAELIQDLSTLKNEKNEEKTVILQTKEEKFVRKQKNSDETIMLPPERQKTEKPNETVLLQGEENISGQGETVILPENKKETSAFKKETEQKKDNRKVPNLPIFETLAKYKTFIVIGIILLLVAFSIPMLVKHSNRANNIGIRETNDTQNGSQSESSGNSPGTNIPSEGNIVNALFIDSRPEGAEIFVDGKDTSFITPKTVRGITPGKHTITLKLQGYEDFKKEITMENEKSLNLTITLIKTQSEVQINSTPKGAEIHIDERDTGKKTPYAFNLKKGTHSVKLTLEGYEPLQTNINVKGEKENFTFALKKEPKKPETGTLVITTEPKGASIFIDKTKFGESPISVKLKNGYHTITASKEGYKTATRKIKVEAGKNLQVSIALKKITFGTLIVKSYPSGAEIYIEEKDTGYKTPHQFTLPVGNYTILLKMKGYKPYTQKVSIIKGVPSIINPELVEEILLKTFLNDKKLYLVKYPIKWTVINHPDEDTDVEFDSPELKDGYVGSCYIYIDDLKKEEITFTGLLKAARESLKEDDNYVILSEGSATIGKNKFYKIVYEGKEKDESGKYTEVKGAIFFLQKNNFVFSIEVAATKADFPILWKEFEAILESFTPFPS